MSRHEGFQDSRHFAVSRSLVKSSATRRDSAMALLKNVISWPTPTTPTTEPLASFRDVALSSTVYLGRMETMWAETMLAESASKKITVGS